MTLSEIIAATAQAAGLKPAEITDGGRTKSVAEARQVVYKLARELTELTLVEIGAGIGGRDHSTVMVGVRRAHDMLSHDRKFRRLYYAAKQALCPDGLNVPPMPVPTLNQQTS